ncbi:MAG: EAL domain-containing protein [Proteobacteria bacterium]|uniref:EAL domain-containing protein n=1 Tax=Aquabacterium sp. TaxID=1872578 RepID=UPI0035C78371|nr:EAL domain-containing protein [Pseudomonadota bacterium]
MSPTPSTSTSTEDAYWKRAVECVGDGVWDWHLPSDEVVLSGRWLGAVGVDGSGRGKRYEAWSSQVHPDDRERVQATLQAHLRGDTPTYVCEYRAHDRQGRLLWVLSRGTVVQRDAEGRPVRMIGILTDVSWRKRAEAFEQFRGDILQQLAHGSDLPALLDATVRGIEQLDPDMLCSILLLDRDGQHLLPGAAPHLPGPYNAAIHGVAIGPCVGSCGTAAFRRQRVIVEDIQTDPLWEGYRELAEDAGLRSCWSEPILSPHGKVLGTFAIYHRTPRRPTPEHIALIEQTARLASIAIERKQAEERLHLAASVFTHAREGIMITSEDGRIIDVNEAFSRITGYARDEVLGHNPRFLKSGRQERGFYTAMWRELIDKGHWHGEVWNRRKNGEHYAEMKTISAVRDEHGAVQQYVALFSDITAFKEHELQLQFNAHHDALTGLPNRVLLADRLKQAMAQTRRRGQRLTVLYLDLDGFKTVNDRHGHETGDQLLMALATRIRHALREGDTLARLGGDEFVAVMQDLADVEQALPVVNRVLAAAAQPVAVGQLTLQVSASLGLTAYPQAEEVDADQLLRQADQAMYQAKLAGKNRYHVFDAEQDRSVRGHHESIEHIRHGLVNREFVLHYQPKVNMRTGQVVGAEALIRWQHPQRGLLAPGSFLPVIEDHPLSLDIGEWVMEAALQQMDRWRQQGLRLPLSINLGARQLQQPDFVERLRTRLAAHPEVRHGDLELEVLETSALGDLARVSQIMVACRDMGVAFALDDFGTGYSSLAYLKRLPVQQLKIDQSFVRDMLDDPDDLAILEGVLGLSRAFRRQVIAEGVETIDHGEMLLYLGCELGQGYGIARPMPAEAIPAWVASWRPDARWLNLPSFQREDVPMLIAEVKHRAWVSAVMDFLDGHRQEPPTLHVQQCCFGQWLHGEARGSLPPHPALDAVDALHDRIHALAETLCDLQAQGHHDTVHQRKGELTVMRDQLLGHLRQLPRLGTA